MLKQHTSESSLNWHGLTWIGGTFESDTGGTFHSDMPGTFQSAADGTFVSAIDGTFQSDMSGTFGPLLSLTFLVTRIGCGIAGFRDEEIAPLFKDTAGMANVILPRTFADILSR